MGGLLCYRVSIHKCVGVPLNECCKPFLAGQYCYTGELAALKQCHLAMPVRLPYSPDCIVTPLLWQAWQASLAYHPDHALPAVRSQEFEVASQLDMTTPSEGPQTCN